MKSVEITGVSELLDMLDKLGPKHANNIMRSTIHGMAATVTKEAKQLAPKDKGTMRKAIKTVRRRSHPSQPVSEVRVDRGKMAKNDAFYWRFVEYGTGGKNPQPARPFIGPAAHKLMTTYRETMVNEFGKKLESALKREARRKSKR